ncbi:hypothetical protein BDZ45DRAFT_597693 [Acephala macrosclerotiorum]|nr:hypothetical protein BDZ45DRAFT_597693 [Acephala macrosclerotiorum]
MKLALEELDYSKVYHFFEVSENATHTQRWIEALEAKYRQSHEGPKSFAIPDWRKLFKDYNAITDIPAACFAPELIAAYPRAKIILTTRSSESWQRSMLRTIGALHSSRLSRLELLFSDEEGKSLFHLLDLIAKYYFHGSISRHGKKVYEEHNELVRKLAIDEKREFLEFRLGDDWGPLCQFLGKDVPEVVFPHVNDSDSFRKYFRLGWYRLPVKVVLCVALWVLGCGMGYWLFQK